MMEGEGIFRWFDGKVYYGYFWQGMMHGKGKLCFGNGQVVEGEWWYGEN